MRKVIIVLSALALSACGTGASAPAPTITVTVTPSTPEGAVFDPSAPPCAEEDTNPAPGESCTWDGEITTTGLKGDTDSVVVVHKNGTWEVYNR